MSEALAQRLPHYGEAVEAAARNLLAFEPAYAGLYHMIQYHLGWTAEPGAHAADAGKRLRSTLCLLVAESVCGDWHGALPAATAIELVHNFSLIHDDIEDASLYRRHRETVWAKWGTAQAINTGDALLMAAFQALLEVPPSLPPEAVPAAYRALTRTCRELCEGQYLDLLWQEVPAVSVSQYLTMVERKTARLFECAAALGALAAGADERTQDQLSAFARSLGLAFQVADDIQGVWSPQAQTGKTAALDVMTRKKTLPLLLGLTRPPGPVSDRLRELLGLGRPLSAEETQEAIALLDALGVRAEARGWLDQLRTEALTHLEKAVLPAGPNLLRAYAEAALGEG